MATHTSLFFGDAPTVMLIAASFPSRFAVTIRTGSFGRAASLAIAASGLFSSPPENSRSHR
jgi:hypothetical protein